MSLFSCAYRPFLYLFWRGVYSNSLPIFLLVILLLSYESSLHILDIRLLPDKQFINFSFYSMNCLFTFWLFFSWVVCFLIIELWEFLYIPNTNSISYMSFANVFSWSVSCLFHSLNSDFQRTKVLNFDEIWFIDFSLWLAHLVLFLRNVCLTQGNIKLSPMFSSSFIVSGLIFRFMIHLELIFVYGVSVGSRFIICIWLSNHSGTISWRLSFLCWIFTFVENQLAM